MTNKIDILSPGKSCWKTRKLVSFLEKFVHKYGVDAEINIITDMKTMLTYRSWILPAVFVNGRPVARACPTASFRRGYRPSEENLFKNLNHKKRMG
jgi:hypothetical protein